MSLLIKALGLRQNYSKISLDNIPNRAFAVAFKTIKSHEVMSSITQNKHSSADMLPGLNVVTYADSIRKLKPTHSLINFEASLRPE